MATETESSAPPSDSERNDESNDKSNDESNDNGKKSNDHQEPATRPPSPRDIQAELLASVAKIKTRDHPWASSSSKTSLSTSPTSAVRSRSPSRSGRSERVQHREDRNGENGGDNNRSSSSIAGVAEHEEPSSGLNLPPRRDRQQAENKEIKTSDNEDHIAAAKRKQRKKLQELHDRMNKLTSPTKKKKKQQSSLSSELQAVLQRSKDKSLPTDARSVSHTKSTSSNIHRSRPPSPNKMSRSSSTSILVGNDNKRSRRGQSPQNRLPKCPQLDKTEQGNANSSNSSGRKTSSSTKTKDEKFRLEGKIAQKKTVPAAVASSYLESAAALCQENAQLHDLLSTVKAKLRTLQASLDGEKEAMLQEKRVTEDLVVKLAAQLQEQEEKTQREETAKKQANLELALRERELRELQANLEVARKDLDAAQDSALQSERQKEVMAAELRECEASAELFRQDVEQTQLRLSAAVQEREQLRQELAESGTGLRQKELIAAELAATKQAKNELAETLEQTERELVATTRQAERFLRQLESTKSDLEAASRDHREEVEAIRLECERLRQERLVGNASAEEEETGRTTLPDGDTTTSLSSSSELTIESKKELEQLHTNLKNANGQLEQLVRQNKDMASELDDCRASNDLIAHELEQTQKELVAYRQHCERLKQQQHHNDNSDVTSTTALSQDGSCSSIGSVTHPSPGNQPSGGGGGGRWRSALRSQIVSSTKSSLGTIANKLRDVKAAHATRNSNNNNNNNNATSGSFVLPPKTVSVVPRLDETTDDKQQEEQEKQVSMEQYQLQLIRAHELEQEKEAYKQALEMMKLTLEEQVNNNKQTTTTAPLGKVAQVTLYKNGTYTTHEGERKECV